MLFCSHCIDIVCRDGPWFLCCRVQLIRKDRPLVVRVELNTQITLGTRRRKNKCLVYGQVHAKDNL